MRTGLTIALLCFIFAVGITPSVSADGDPIGRCPDGFQLHLAMHHDDHHEHHHIGTATDQNGDGWICFKHVGAADNNHVHTDNHAALR
ncbi:MAG: hypothetical protein HY868_15490 [Chloroflexi bacterium]|nr:hypothetical protein [Chloroflexota bacterium]